MNRSANRLLIVGTKLNGFGLAITDDSPNSPNFPALWSFIATCVINVVQIKIINCILFMINMFVEWALYRILCRVAQKFGSRKLVDFTDYNQLTGFIWQQCLPYKAMFFLSKCFFG